MELEKLTVGFIGGGNMARAIGQGLINKGVLTNSQLHVSAPSVSTVQYWSKNGVHATHKNEDVVSKCDIIFLAFKPYQLDSVLQAIQHAECDAAQSKLFVSVLVGITNDAVFTKLVDYVQANPRLIRAMPNTAMEIAEGCSALAPHPTATHDDVEVTSKMFSSLGKCEVIGESLMTSVAALTGSGPAYVYMIIEALSDGAVKQGVPRPMATALAAQTVLGAAKMVLVTHKHPGQLKDDVCSAGGSTICGVHALEKGNLRCTLMNAIEAATKRGEEIGKMNK